MPGDAHRKKKLACLVIADHNLSFVWSAINREYLREQIVDPFKDLTRFVHDVAFCICAVSIESWFIQHAPESVGICIVDDMDKPDFRRKLTESLRNYRRVPMLPDIPHTQFAMVVAKYP